MRKLLFLTVFLLSAIPASAQITSTGRKAMAANAGSGTSITATIASQASGNANVVSLTWCDNSACSLATASDTFTVTDGAGNSYNYSSPDISYNSGSGNIRLTTVHATGIATSASNVITASVTSANTVYYLTISASEWAGMATTPKDLTATNSTAGSSLSLSSGTNTSVPNEMVYAFAVISGGVTLSASGSYTTINNSTLNVGDEYLIVSSTGTQTATMTFTGGGTQSYEMILVTYEATNTGGVPIISPLNPVVSAGGATQTFTVTANPGTGGAWTCANNGGACLGSINSGTGVYTPPATMAAQQSIGGYQLLPNDHVINTNISGLPARSDGATFTISAAPTGLVRDATGTIATITYSPGFSVPAVGTYIVVTGATDSSFNTSGTNGTVLTGCGGTCTTFTYANTGTANATSGGGTLTVPWASGMGTLYLNFLPSFPVNYTNASTHTSPMTFSYTPGNNATFSIPTCPTLVIESGCGSAIANTTNVDHHFIGVRTDTGVVQEFYQINNGASCWTGTCTSQSGVKYNYSDYALAGGGNGTTDAAGLPLLPLTLRSSEVANACANSGTINHAVRMTVGNGYLNNSHIWPATTHANEGGINPYGQRFRLKAAYVITGFSACAQTVLTALKNYGVILADGGLGWQVNVAFDDMNPTVATALQSINSANIAVTNWETVDESSLKESALSGATTTGEVVTYTASTGSASTNVDLQGTNLDVPRNQIYIAAGTPQQLLTVYSNGAFTCAMSPTEGSISANASGCLYTAPGSIGSETDTTITVTSSVVGSMKATMLVHIFPIAGMRLTQDTSNYTDSMSNVWYAGGAYGYGLSNAPRWVSSNPNNPSITGTDKQLFWNNLYISGETADYHIDFLVPQGTYFVTYNNGTYPSGSYSYNLFAQGGFLGTVNPVTLVGNNGKWTFTQPVSVVGNALSFYVNGTGNASGAGISSFSIMQNSASIPVAPALKSILVQ